MAALRSRHVKPSSRQQTHNTWCRINVNYVKTVKGSDFFCPLIDNLNLRPNTKTTKIKKISTTYRLSRHYSGTSRQESKLQSYSIF